MDREGSPKNLRQWVLEVQNVMLMLCFMILILVPSVRFSLVLFSVLVPSLLVLSDLIYSFPVPSVDPSVLVPFVQVPSVMVPSLLESLLKVFLVVRKNWVLELYTKF